MLKRSLFALGALVFLLCLSACASAPAADSRPASQTVSLKVLNLPFIAFAPFWIAQDQGYFKEQGLDVQFVNMSDQNNAVSALVSGQVDVTAANIGAGMFNSIARGAPIKFVADKGYINPQSCANNMIVLRPELLDAQGSVNPDQLRGKTFDIQRGTWLE